MPDLSRRKTLALIGGGTVLAAGAGIGAFAATRTPHAALAPWDAAGAYADPRMRALSYALLAPNPHNRQPWEAELIGTDGITIWRDPARDLLVTDPFARQLTIGMGCFLELARMAADAEGLATETTLFPAGEAGPVARLRLVPGGTPDPLFAHVMERRSHKAAFELRPVTADAAAPLARHATLHLDGRLRDDLRQLAQDAWRTEMATPAALKESIDLLRIGRNEIEANPDGIDLGGPLMEGLARAGLLTRAAAMDPDNPGTRRQIEGEAAIIMGAPAMLTLVTPGNTRRDQIAAGRRWLRLNLAATGAGLAIRPVSQALQEYPEMAAHLARAHALAAPDGGTVQMLGLLGYAARTARTPRWPLETRMRDA
ncbi:Acg family FMN-binding oxidoreductase [Jannaschia ovalis]|uniref:Twin-arginine translocation pathway signal protein n=1 Tax=Jannaschia ovalis TaxID=3038773 RepID=A0ABY8LGY6_9RHOB|nr:twin-arginine translocation pathway signal protein [Jannaschia sp. GRR-S6-38]WGH79439.1 twin-arginine translocation pathway signal protein [Jannaschia sp. GRR-S6-38]